MTTNKMIEDILFKNVSDKENANSPDYVFTAKQNKISSNALKKYALDNLLSDKVREAFLENKIYIHDFGSYAVGLHNCTTIDLAELLKDGFYTNNSTIREPKSIRSAFQLTAVILQCQSNLQFGGIAVGTLDFDLAPYVDMSFRKYFKTGLRYFLNWDKNAVDAYCSQVEDYLDSIGCEHGISLNSKELVNWSTTRKTGKAEFAKVLQYAYEQTREECMQSAEAFIHNLNSLQSRSGDQLPFTSVNYGVDTSESGRLVTESMLRATIKGVGKNNQTPIFPIQVFGYFKGVNDVDGTPNYDLKKLAIECMTKRIYPNFVNVTADHFDKPTCKQEIVPTMGCRTMLGKDRHGVVGYQGRGNISPTTINLTKIGILNGITMNDEPDVVGFTEMLKEYLDICVQSLVERFEYQAKQKAKSAPYMYKNKVWKHTDNIDDETEVREILKHGTLAIGLLGLSNAMIAMFGKHHFEDEKVYKFALNIYKYVNAYAERVSDEYDLNFSVYSTPAESLCRTMWEKNVKEFGEIEGVLDKGYLNNSFHCPVYYQIDPFEKIEKEAPFHKLSKGGVITYVEVDGNARKNTKAMEQLIDFAMEKNVSYFAINHPIDICTNCEHEGIIGSSCPQCSKSENEVYIKRLRRVTGYITNDYQNYFNEGKRLEVLDRYKHLKGNE